MQHGYYIKTNEENKLLFELAYVENNGNFKEHGTCFDTVDLAQKVAQEHYEEIILENILVLRPFPPKVHKIDPKLSIK